MRGCGLHPVGQMPPIRRASSCLSGSIDKLGGQMTNELQFLTDDAKAKFEVGEISFIEFLQIQQQRSELELSYLQLINQYNQTSIQLNWYR